LSKESGFRYIVRIGGIDIPGTEKVAYGLAKIKGIGVNTAYAICRVLNIDPESRIGLLSEEDVERIEDVLSNFSAYKIPSWMYNRRRDIETGKDLHLYGPDLIFAAKKDIETMKKIKSWKGIRHALGLKVRGQRTRTTGRLGTTVGVKRKK